MILCNRFQGLFLTNIPFGFVLFSFVFFLFSFYFSKRDISRSFKNVSRREWAALLLIVSAAFILRALLSPDAFLMMGDESGYIKDAHSYLIGDAQRFYSRHAGWSILLAGLFKVFHFKIELVFLLNKIIGALTVMNVFALSYLLFRDAKLSLLSGAVFALLPLHVKWSGGACSNAAGLYFSTLFFCALLLSIRSGTVRSLLFCLGVFSTAVLFRPENYFLALLLPAAPFIFKKQTASGRYPLYALTAVLTAPNILYALNEYACGPGPNRICGPNLNQISLDPGNIAAMQPFSILHQIFSAQNYPAVFVVSLLIGFFVLMKQKSGPRAFVLCMLFVFIVPLLFFPHYTPQERPILNFYPALAICSGLGLRYLLERTRGPFLKTALFAVFFAPFALFLFNFGKYLDHPYEPYGTILSGELLAKIPAGAQRDLPADSVVFANNAQLLRVLPFRIEESSEILNDPGMLKGLRERTGSVFYFEGPECFSDGLYVPEETKRTCADMKKKFSLHAFREYTLTRSGRTAAYTFYRIGPGTEAEVPSRTAPPRRIL